MSAFIPVSPLVEPGQRHLLHQVVQFSRLLHTAGLSVHPAGLVDLCRCLQYVDIRNRPDFHAAARATLVSSQADITAFEAAFAEFWAVPGMHRRQQRDTPEDSQEDPSGQPEPRGGQMLSLAESEGAEREPGQEDDQVAWSASEVLLKKDFREMSDQELEAARRVLAELVALLANTASRRTVATRRRGELDLRRMLRRNALRAGDGMEFRFRKRQIKRTRLMLLCDVSGSMERYSRFLIQFIYALRQQLARIDVAVFSTRLTEITDLLRWQSVDRSLREVAEHARDWGGGTDIGRSLQAFNDRFAAGMRRTHTVAVILSDGWDRGDSARMRDEMQRLNQRVQRLIWLNPLLGNDEYQPLCQGMRTALPFIDDFLPAHNLESLAGLVRHLRSLWR